jgi:hypothetical protein
VIAEVVEMLKCQVILTLFTAISKISLSKISQKIKNILEKFEFTAVTSVETKNEE